ncbi:MAG: nucleotidyl transferase AbiEii/AbiGii toxin family protein [Patescibacteria group bacterium]
MISLDQIKELASKNKIDESVIAREFIQIFFLNELYSYKFSRDIYFKGGTAIRLLYGGSRFSEDLDFTANLDLPVFESEILKVFSDVESKYPIKCKAKKALVGKSYLLTTTILGFKTPVYVKLDFSFRESVIEPQNRIMETVYPIIVKNYINSLSINEIIAEKVRAILTRKKMRDLYDLWVLIELGGKIDFNLIDKKLAYYREKFNKKEFIERLTAFNEKEFIQDLKPFIRINERENLAKLFIYITDYIKKKFS